jgi:catechol 2,3-dioxygenase-like lactoylglutathione lyase family enzyme
MLSAITHFNLWVTDQDEALEFYVGKLGMEVHTDLRLDFLRWLTVNVPGRPEQQLILAPLGPPVVDPDNADRARDLLSKGVLGVFIVGTPDLRTTYETLVARGVEFTQGPTEQPYGMDCAARDPFGNQIRFQQLALSPTA